MRSTRSASASAAHCSRARSAVLAARNDETVSSVTFLTTMLDFDDPGEIGVFVTREMLAAREAQLLAGQRVRGSELAGRVREPARQRSRLELRRQQLSQGPQAAGVRPALLERRFRQSAGADVRVLHPRAVPRKPVARARCTDDARREDRSRPHHGPGVRVRLARRPHRSLANRRTARSVSSAGPTSFVLGASGHIAGVVNPPEAHKRNYWTHDGAHRRRRRLAGGGDAVTPGAGGRTGIAGSRSTRAVNARRRRSRATRRYPALAAAPGDYVRESVG